MSLPSCVGPRGERVSWRFKSMFVVVLTLEACASTRGWDTLPDLDQAPPERLLSSRPPMKISPIARDGEYQCEFVSPKELTRAPKVQAASVVIDQGDVCMVVQLADKSSTCLHANATYLSGRQRSGVEACWNGPPKRSDQEIADLLRENHLLDSEEDVACPGWLTAFYAQTDKDIAAGARISDSSCAQQTLAVSVSPERTVKICSQEVVRNLKVPPRCAPHVEVDVSMAMEPKVSSAIPRPAVDAVYGAACAKKFSDTHDLNWLFAANGFASALPEADPARSMIAGLVKPDLAQALEAGEAAIKEDDTGRAVAMLKVANSFETILGDGKLGDAGVRVLQLRDAVKSIKEREEQARTEALERDRIRRARVAARVEDCATVLQEIASFKMTAVGRTKAWWDLIRVPWGNCLRKYGFEKGNRMALNMCTSEGVADPFMEACTADDGAMAPNADQAHGVGSPKSKAQATPSFWWEFCVECPYRDIDCSPTGSGPTMQEGIRSGCSKECDRFGGNMNALCVRDCVETYAYGRKMGQVYGSDQCTYSVRKSK